MHEIIEELRDAWHEGWGPKTAISLTAIGCLVMLIGIFGRLFL